MNLIQSAFLAAYYASSLPHHTSRHHAQTPIIYTFLAAGMTSSMELPHHSSHMLVITNKIVDDFPLPTEHEIISSYTSSFSPANSLVDEQGVSFIASNDPDGYAPGLYSDFDMIIDSSGETEDIIYYYQVHELYLPY